VSESFLFRSIMYLPATNDLSPTLKLNGMFMMVCRSDCPSTDETVKSTSRPEKAIARLMLRMVLSFSTSQISAALRLPYISITRERCAVRATKTRGSTQIFCVDLCYLWLNLPISLQVMSFIWLSCRSLRKVSLVKKSKSRCRQAAPQSG